jgi:ABC-type transport system involved in multi-copper enzyme maturation permease subunit
MQSLVQYVLKFVAILRDSLQETLDSKVLYAMFALSGLIILAVASISFEPKPAAKGVEAILDRFPFAKRIPFSRQEPPLRYELQDFVQTNDKEPWEGSYRFTIVVHEQNVLNSNGQAEPAKGFFKYQAWQSSLMVEQEEMTAEDRATRKRLQKLQEEAVMAQQQGKGLQDLLAKVTAEINSVTPAQMERYIKAQLAAQGTLVAKSVRYAPQDKDDLRFEVETEAKAETFRTWPHKAMLGFGAYTYDEDALIGNQVFFVQDKLIGGIGAGIAMLIASIVTSFFIPNMLRKGTVDMLLAKPLSRWLLLVYKFIGGLLFMLLNTAVVVVGIWLALGLRSGLWAPGFLLSIFVMTFQFAIFYAISTLVGVTTRSPIVSILAACFAWFILWGVGTFHLFVDATRDLDLLPKWVVTTTDTANFLLPRYKDLDALSERLTARDLIGPESPEHKAMEKIYGKISWGSSIGFTLGWIAIGLGLSCAWFAWKDY